MKQANNNLKKVRLPASKEELQGQEADYAAWEAQRQELLRQLGGSSPSGPQQQQAPEQPQPQPQPQPSGAPGTGTDQGGSGAGAQPVTGSVWWAFAGLLLAMTTFTGYVLWAYTRIGG